MEKVVKIKEALMAYIESEANNDSTIFESTELKINRLFGYFLKDNNGIVVGEAKGIFDEVIFNDLWQSVKLGLQILGEFSEYNGQLYCYDINGKSAKDILTSYNHNKGKGAPYFLEQIPADEIMKIAKMDFDLELKYNEANYQSKLSSNKANFNSELLELQNQNALLQLQHLNQKAKETYDYKINSIDEYDKVKRAVINPMVFFRELYQFGVWVKDKKQKTLPHQPISVNESRTKKVILETITNIDKQGWQYAFVSELDYNLFTDLLTNYFEYNPYTLPETIIQLKRTCKTKVAKALGEIHKELSNENKLRADTEYFKIIRVLSHFKNETEGDLYKALTR